MSERPREQGPDRGPDDRGGAPDTPVRAFYDDMAPFAESVWGGDEHEVRFFLDRLGPGPGELLDLGVGAGRIACPAVRAGWRVLGVDGSPRMLALARRARLTLPRPADLRLVLAAADRFAVRRPFAHAIACGLFFHLRAPVEYRRVLAAAFRLLRPGGRLLLDVEHRPDGGWGEAGGVRHLGRVRDGDGWLLLGRRLELDSRRGEQVATFEIERIDGEGRRTLVRRHRQRGSFVGLERMAGLVEEAGLRVERCWGDYDGRPYDPASPELILDVRRPR